ncbi:hypothetical protein B0H14DRAFT_3460332 [Mycena olivaceomarginata]|nr:hypothetical protein B0H14DRAFT_3460332 [Mycena olivaceomarginata]
MSRQSLTLDKLLNPESVDAAQSLREFQEILGHLDLAKPILVSPDIQRHLQNLLSSWPELPPSSASRTHPAASVEPTAAVHPLSSTQANRTVEYNVTLNYRTQLSVLYRYPKGAYVEYPESGIDGPIGHLIPDVDSTDADSTARIPWTDFAYSRGAPEGGTLAHEMIYTPLLVDEAGNPVLCRIRHSTCLGVKAYVQRKLAQEREARLLHSSPERDPFKSWAAGDPDNKRLLAQRQRPLSLSKCKQLSDTSSVAIKPPTRATAESSTTSSMAEMGNLLSCEHYSSRTRNHWVDFNIQDGSLHLEYVAAVFTGDTEEALQIERAAREKSVGPLAVCQNVTNYSSQRNHCPVDHREHEDGPLVRHQMCRIDCHVKFRAWIPVNRSECPYILITSEGVHKHPIPLPEKTPQADLPTLTARRFLRHPAIKSYLYTTFPDLRNPTLSHLHPSLANRAHLRVQHLKRLQDEQLPRHLHYIRVMLDIKNDSLPAHEEDEPPLLPEEKSTRIIICMTPHSSSRLQKAQYLQSDIGFKRIVGYDEFEISAMDRDANTSVVFCRVYLTRHTAAAHQRIFEEIDKIVEFDGGRRLRWRHLHGQSLEDFQGLILHWGADQHRGQAKGESHLSFAALPPGQMDLHESWRTLRSLGPYEHLRRIYRLCKVHNYRNIQTCSVSDPVRQLMRSLACIEHPSWDATIAQIIADGGKAGADWVRDKVTSNGEPNTNLAEAVHSDVNREGVHCTLLGGLLRGQDYDAMQHETLLQYEQYGIRPSYNPVAPVTNTLKNLKRKGLQQAKKVQASMKAVSEHNINLHRAHAGLAASLQISRGRAACSSQLVRP